MHPMLPRVHLSPPIPQLLTPAVLGAIVVERFDRVRVQGVLRRVHQEDCCQALAITPTRKYESDGGPGAVAVATLLARHSSNPEVDVARFLDAMMFNWLIGGTDAHAKNFAVLHGAPGDVRLAPLYDVISALPYPSLGGASGSLAMSIHGERAIDRLDGSHWRGLARAVGFAPSMVLERLDDLSARLPDAAQAVIADHDAQPLARTIVERLLQPVVAHAHRCRFRLS
jgi:serine/threonine-protein kinase HipA